MDQPEKPKRQVEEVFKAEKQASLVRAVELAVKVAIAELELFCACFVAGCIEELGSLSQELHAEL
jgi:hypothetical protein